METTNSFDIVRISSHGEFIDEPLYDESKKVIRSGEDVKFNIHFRGGIGSTVLTRCNTRDTQLINGKQQCSSFIGRRDFSKNMEITLNDGGISESDVMGCKTSKVPDMLLTFNEDFVSGFALYREDGSPLYCNGNYVSLDKFKIEGVEKEEIKLREVLKIIYNELQVKRGEIDIYISSCLYINPDILNDIKTNYPQWFECNRQNIIVGYEKEFKDNAKIIETLQKEVTDLNIRISDLNKPKPANKNTKLFLQILNRDVVDGGDLNDYVYLYIKNGEVDPDIPPFDKLLFDYIIKHNIVINEGEYTEEQYRETSNTITNGLKEQLENTEIDTSDIDKYRNDLVKKHDTLSRTQYNNSKILKAIESSQKRKVDNYGDWRSRLKNVRQKRGGKKKDLTYKLKCLEKCKCKRQRVKKKNMKYDMKQLEKNNKCYDKCYKRCFKKTLKKKGGTLNRRHSSAPASIQYTDKLPSHGAFKDIIDDNDAYDEFIRQLATNNDKYSLKSCLELKNYTLANRRSMLDPIVKKHVKKCSKAIVINNFFNFVKEEYDKRPNIGLQIHVTYALERYRQRCIDRECITGDKTNMLFATNMEKVIMDSDYYNFPLEIRKVILEIFKKILSEGLEQGIIHSNKDPSKILYSVILFYFVSILVNKGLNEFRIIFMGIIQNIQNKLREINVNEDIIDEVVIKFVKSLYWNKVILL